jgi:hypothetical protein
MVLKYVTKNGMRIHEPPPEEDEFYRRIEVVRLLERTRQRWIWNRS